MESTKTLNGYRTRTTFSWWEEEPHMSVGLLICFLLLYRNFGAFFWCFFLSRILLIPFCAVNILLPFLFLLLPLIRWMRQNLEHMLCCHIVGQHRRWGDAVAHLLIQYHSVTSNLLETSLHLFLVHPTRSPGFTYITVAPSVSFILHESVFMPLVSLDVQSASESCSFRWAFLV